MMTDPVSDMLTRIRNGLMIKQERVRIRSSKLAKHLSEILKRTGFIKDCEEDKSQKFPSLVLTMKYDQSGDAVIEGLSRISRPGLRVYRSSKELPRVRGGLGVAIVSTSKGVMTCHEAKKLGIGGEVICQIW